MNTFQPVSLKKFESNAKGGFVLTNDETQGFLWCIQEDRNAWVANPVIYKRLKDAKKHIRKKGSFERIGRTSDQVIQNFIAQIHS